MKCYRRWDALSIPSAGTALLEADRHSSRRARRREGLARRHRRDGRNERADAGAPLRHARRADRGRAADRPATPTGARARLTSLPAPTLPSSWRRRGRGSSTPRPASTSGCSSRSPRSRRSRRATSRASSAPASRPTGSRCSARCSPPTRDTATTRTRSRNSCSPSTAGWRSSSYSRSDEADRRCARCGSGFPKGSGPFRLGAGRSVRSPWAAAMTVFARRRPTSSGRG